MLTKKAYSESQIMDILNDYIVRHPNEFDESVVQNRLKNGPRMNVDQMVAFVHERLKREKMMGLPGYQKAGLGVAAGFEDTAAGLTRILAKLPSSTLKQINQDVQRSRKELDQDFNISNPGTSQKALKGIAGIGSAIALPGVGEDMLGAVALKTATKFAPNALEGAIKILEKIPSGATSKTIKNILKSAPGTAAVSAISADDDESISSSIEKGGAIQAGISAAFPIAGKIYEKGVSKIPKLISSRYSPSKILENLEKFKTKKVIGGGEVPVTGGEIMGSDTLKKYQSNVSPYIPFSGQASKFAKINNKLKQSATRIYQHFLGGNDEDYLLDDVMKNIKKSYFDAVSRSGENYHKLDAYLEKNGLFMDFKNLRSVAAELLKEYNDATRFHGAALGNSDIHNILSSYADLPEKMTESIEKNPTLTEAVNSIVNLLTERSKPVTNLIGEDGLPKGVGKNMQEVGLNEPIKYSKIAKNELNKMGDAEESAYRKRIYKSLSGALDKDIKNVTEKNSGAKKLADKADAFYREHLAKFYDPEVTQFTIGDSHPTQIFSAFIKMGKNENPTKMEKFVNLLTKDDKKAVIAAAMKNLKDIDGDINPYKLARFYKSLGGRTKKALLSGKENEALQLLEDRASLSQSAEKQMLDPATGNSMLTPEGMKMVKTLLGAGAAGSVAHFLGAIKLSSILTANRAATYALNNPSVIKHIAETSTGKKNIAKKIAESEKVNSISKAISRLMAS